MRKLKKIQVESHVIDEIICNKCGQAFKVGPYGGFEGLEEAEVTGGYGSNHIGDGNRYRFSICEKCLLELFQTFVVPPCFYDWGAPIDESKTSGSYLEEKHDCLFEGCEDPIREG
jgi:hypothetical protein